MSGLGQSRRLCDVGVESGSPPRTDSSSLAASPMAPDPSPQPPGHAKVPPLIGSKFGALELTDAQSFADACRPFTMIKYRLRT
jgi:hypothetical protein